MGRAHLSLLAALFGSAFLLVAVVVWATAAPAPAPREVVGAQPPPVTVTPSVTPVRPVPPGMATAHPGVGVVIGARGTYPPGTPDILNHAAFNLSLAADCAGCPIPILDVLGLNPANEGVLATYELNPSNARQQVSDNWEWYWPRVTDSVYLWASAPQEFDFVGGEWRPLFTPGMIFIQRAAWHQDPADEWHQPRALFCAPPAVTPGGPPVTPGGPPDFNVAPEPTVGYVIAPPFPLATPTNGPSPTPLPPGAPTPTPALPRPLTEWKYWACAGPLTDTAGLPTFAMYDRDGFEFWIDRNQGQQYIVGNEEEYYMLPDAYAAWYKLIYGIMQRDLAAELYIAGLGVWPYTFGPGLGNVIPAAYKGWQAPPNPTAPPAPPGAAGPYPPPPTSGGYPPPGGGAAGAPLLPAPGRSTAAPALAAPASVLDSTPVPSPRALGAPEDWARASWLPAVLLTYRNLYCPAYCVDDAGLPPAPATPDSFYNRMPSAGFMAHLYAVAPDQVIDSCDDAAWSYAQWAFRLGYLSYYLQRWEDCRQRRLLYSGDRHHQRRLH